MADTFVYSTDENNMRDYPLWVQAPAGESPYSYSVGDLRMLAAPYAPSAGVAHWADFRVTNVDPGFVQVSDGVGVTSPTGVTGARTRERYLFASDGPVNVPVYTNPGASPRFHRLVAMAHDEQLAMSASFSPWSFHLIEDTGTPPSTNGPNAIPIATIRVDPGQTAGYTITDLRCPCSHPMSSQLRRSTSAGGANAGSDYQVLRFTAEDDDPWHMTDVANDNATIWLRTAGLYDLYLGVQSPVSTGQVEIGIYIDSDISSPDIIGPSMVKVPASSTGTHVSSVTLGHYLPAGTQVRGYLWTTTANVTYDGAWLRVFRREWRP